MEYVIYIVTLLLIPVVLGLAVILCGVLLFTCWMVAFNIVIYPWYVVWRFFGGRHSEFIESWLISTPSD